MRSLRVSAVSASPLSPSASAPVDDKSVPEGHKGLHTYLYGAGGAEAHEQGSGGYEMRQGEDEGGAVVPVAAYLQARDGEKPLGVYCVYDSDGSPAGHLARMGPQRCASVRTTVYGNRAMASRTTLERGLANWVAELPELGGKLPPGNADPALRAAWEGVEVGAQEAAADGPGAVEGVASPAVLDTRLMSPAELAAYEDKRMKMRKAMGEKMVEGPGGGAASAPESGPDGAVEAEEGDDLETRRRKLMKAMDRGDWSAAIAAQTQEAIGSADAPAADSPPAPAQQDAAAAAPSESSSSSAAEGGSGAGAGGAVVSPFTEGRAGAASVASVSMSSVDGGGSGPKLTVEAVQMALEEVRPYLMADGGDVEVVDVEGGVVYLRLQVRDILQLDKQEPAATVAQVDMALNMLRGAIHNYGGSVEVLSVEGGVATLRYKGPPAIGKGIQGALRDSFHDIKEIRLVD
ncbi:hypothetical protein GPECTOR_24g204 [Gonium pectorale]|uniref:NIF system FeS cluster assembly NifU C-terminal domain-containing protein n=1 Tax=Gonium pectorale TaxID=33097 RepID=A0A150GH12_GONPE|nr:hypothetical protein GPECTOR_24g204 [Gonium pectorale]|eukprot:KXZ48915.1 hypothetical protein GPECTOR_24g204 [Gonium pectorale]